MYTWDTEMLAAMKDISYNKMLNLLTTDYFKIPPPKKSSVEEKKENPMLKDENAADDNENENAADDNENENENENAADDNVNENAAADENTADLADTVADFTTLSLNKSENEDTTDEAKLTKERTEELFDEQKIGFVDDREEEKKQHDPSQSSNGLPADANSNLERTEAGMMLTDEEIAGFERNKDLYREFLNQVNIKKNIFKQFCYR